MTDRLETPRAGEVFYLGQGDECADLAHRPLFTGDVIDLAGRLLCVMLHPCAMRRGDELVPKILVCPVVPLPPKRRTDWAARPHSQGFLPNVYPDGGDGMVDFLDVESIPSAVLAAAPRIAVCEAVTINFLLQRWIHHCTRVVVLTATIHESIRAQMEEAEIRQDATATLVYRGFDEASARAVVSGVLSSKGLDGKRLSALLEDTQRVSAVRRAVRSAVAEAIADVDRGGRSTGA